MEITNTQREALKVIADAVIESVEVAGKVGAPAGTLYAALMAHGCSLSQFESLMAVLVRLGKLRKEGHLYFAGAKATLIPAGLCERCEHIGPVTAFVPSMQAKQRRTPVDELLSGEKLGSLGCPRCGSRRISRGETEAQSIQRINLGAVRCGRLRTT